MQFFAIRLVGSVIYLSTVQTIQTFSVNVEFMLIGKSSHVLTSFTRKRCIRWPATESRHIYFYSRHRLRVFQLVITRNDSVYSRSFNSDILQYTRLSSFDDIKCLHRYDNARHIKAVFRVKMSHMISDRQAMATSNVNKQNAITFEKNTKRNQSTGNSSVFGTCHLKT